MHPTMSRRVRLLFLVAGLVAAADALACRPRVVEPMQLLTDPDPEYVVQDVFVGEIVALRDLLRLEALRGCHPEHSRPAREGEHDGLDCISVMGAHFEMEVYPTEVLRGAPSYPSRVTVSDCGSLPRIGSTAVVVRTTRSDGFFRVAHADEPEFHSTYDAGYIDEVKQCLAGECPDALR